MAHEDTNTSTMDAVFIHVRKTHRTEAVSDEDAAACLERHQAGDWGYTGVKAPGENEYSIKNFHLTSYVLSEYRQEPEDQSIMIFTALYTGRTVIFRRGELSWPFMTEYLCEMLDLAGGD
jgi:hypothetical protein